MNMIWPRHGLVLIFLLTSDRHRNELDVYVHISTRTLNWNNENNISLI